MRSHWPSYGKIDEEQIFLLQLNGPATPESVQSNLWCAADGVGERIPVVPLGTRMSDAVVEMTGKGLGCVGILDAHGMLAGIITDGDLRRHMRPDLLSVNVDEVMTRQPKTVRPDQLASEALEILNSSKITALIVAEGKRPVGILHLHDLLRAGVA